MFDLQPPRHIPTLPNSEVELADADFRFSPQSRHPCGRRSVEPATNRRQRNAGPTYVVHGLVRK